MSWSHSRSLSSELARLGVKSRPRLVCEVSGSRPVRIELFDLFARVRAAGQVMTVDWFARATKAELAVFDATITLEQ